MPGPAAPAAGTGARAGRYAHDATKAGRREMHGIIYLVGLVVVILAVLSFFGMR
ncbi:MAG: hypothetical protein AB7O63_07645 [Reyranellaceae bacterium]